METARGKTAIARTGMSRPLAMALGDTIVTPEMTVLDYGALALTFRLFRSLV